MNTQNQAQHPNIIDDSKKLIAGLLFTASLSSSKAQQLLVLNAARKIAQLEKNAAKAKLNGTGTGLPSGLGAKEVTDRQLRLLQHCLGSYDPDEADGCEHFPDGDVPSVPEAASLLILLQTGDFSAVPNKAKFAEFLQHPDADVLLAASEGKGEESEGGTEEAQPTAVISPREFFEALNGKTPEPLSGPIETLEDTKKALLNAVSEDVAVNGSYPADDAERIERGVRVSANFLGNVMANLPSDVDPNDLLTKLEAERDHLGMHIENGDVPESHLAKAKGFHNFLSRILENTAPPAAA